MLRVLGVSNDPLSHGHGHSNLRLATERRGIELELYMQPWAVSQLKSRLNELTMVAWLPNELLSEIFVQLAASQYEAAVRTRRLVRRDDTARPYGWLSACHVCRHWRTVAFHSPRVWNRLALKRPPVADLSLARSKSVALSVVAEFRSENDDIMRAWELVAPHVARVRNVWLSGAEPALRSACAKLVGPASALEELVIERTLFSRGTADNGTEPPFLSFREGELPRLRRLEIRALRSSIHWHNPVFTRGLTTLVVVGSAAIGTFDELLAALEPMESLEVLKLENVIPAPPRGPSAAPDFPEDRVVALPELRSIRLACSSVSCAHLLAHLALPPDVELEIVGRNAWGVSELLRSFAAHLARARPLRALDVAGVNGFFGFHIHLSGWRASRAGGGDAPVRLSITDVDASLAVSEVVFVPARGAWADVRQLKVGNVASVDWEHMCAVMPRLESLAVDGYPGPTFLGALSPALDAALPLPLPHLRSLALCAVRLSHGYGAEAKFVDSLCELLRSRTEEGIPIDTVHVNGCLNVSMAYLHMLQEVTSDVQWDGIES